MKKQTFIIMSTLALISCTSNKYSYEDYKATTTKDCSQANFSQNKINRVNVPNIPVESPSPAQSGLKKIDESINTSSNIGILKDNKFITLYTSMNSGFIMGKIFNSSGEEIINRFKIAESTESYKLVTDNRLDYFLVFYLLQKGNNFEKELFVKKFDLLGNQIGNETKLNADIESFLKANYSFDQDGTNLILSWIDVIVRSEKERNNCIPFLPCIVPAIAPLAHKFAVIKYIKFDDNLNYCFNSVGLDKEVTNNNFFTSITSYITQDREKIIFSSDDKTIKILSLKDNQIKDIVIDVKKSFSYINKFAEDNESYYFINIHDSLEKQSFYSYKLNKDFKVIDSKDEIDNSEIKSLSVEDLKVNNDKIEIFPSIFFDNNLNLFKFEKSNIEPYNIYSSQTQSIFRLDNKLLYVNGDNFAIL